MRHKALVIFLYIYTLSFSFFKTVRWPNEWSQSHWLMDYRFGFIKRGFAGEIFGFFFEKNEYQIQILSAVILFLLYVTILITAVKHTLQNYSIHKVLFYVVFFLSQYAILSAHLIGYLDHVIFLLTMLALFLIRNKKYWWASLLCTVSVMIHEITFFIMLPICLFALLVSEWKGHKPVFTSAVLKKAAFFLIIPMGATFLISVYQEFFGKDNRDLIFQYLKYSGLISDRVSGVVADAYTESFLNYLKQESPTFFLKIYSFGIPVKFGIPIAFMFFVLYKQFRKVNQYTILLLYIISLFPLLLHAIAWDTFRIWSFSYMILFLGFEILDTQFKTVRHFQKVNGFEILFFVSAVLTVSIFNNMLFDQEIERFSKPERLCFLIPVFSVVFYLMKNAPIQNIEA
ncbi:hypothetical protein DRF65_19010 [Chryseobacterium pennae]|uniref:EpsG family protein n=1 Tax=Chryseobacterium pennae TaxID=2258962 RepID=A0A3D9C5T5_9FLAO|nr:hypothetical protein [Chryseobacterium pennae]REC60892.1 hypothetical protein DRF65_19010 [Chryseobacterium pennae]